MKKSKSPIYYPELYTLPLRHGDWQVLACRIFTAIISRSKFCFWGVCEELGVALLFCFVFSWGSSSIWNDLKGRCAYFLFCFEFLRHSRCTFLCKFSFERFKEAGDALLFISAFLCFSHFLAGKFISVGKKRISTSAFSKVMRSHSLFSVGSSR